MGKVIYIYPDYSDKEKEQGLIIEDAINQITKADNKLKIYKALGIIMPFSFIENKIKEQEEFISTKTDDIKKAQALFSEEYSEEEETEGSLISFNNLKIENVKDIIK
ncbi:MAG: hypothetical protein N4A47_01320 [Clostridia bacterium]|jgi:hypothetical protein|nr:hypothetical protein [Clostridia bacterium]